MRTAEIGQRFLDFFESKGHAVVPSASLLYNDPTLLFVNAGMVPFKHYLMGVEPSPWKRATSIQKCVRTLDIDEVGKTTRHGTFFQMLGNFSFGDYFKHEAITWAWELVTTPQDQGGFGFDPADIWVTVLGPGFHPDYPDGDVEARRTWLEVGVPADHIQGRSLKDNYWHMGVPGPGGPCSEIYIDRGPRYGAEGGPEADEDRYLEIWNLVFETEDLSTVRAKDDFDISGPLASLNIDTGAGLERIALLLQGVGNMYETDQVYPVIAKAAELSGRTYGADHDDDVRMRVVADHVRSSLMLMTDGVTPGNEARGYVLRRLLRRVVRAMRLLGVEEPVLPQLLPISRDLMADTYPDVLTQWERVIGAATAEEETFRRTLSSGTTMLDTAVSQTRAAGSGTLSGQKAFQLHDTYGFPIDLTLEMAAEQGLDVDRATFDSLMAEQKDRAKADARAKKGLTTSTEAYTQLRAQGETPFLGFTDLSVPTSVTGIISEGRAVTSAPSGSVVEVVLAETPFYAEMGGQDSDTGVIRASGFDLDVLDVQRPVPGLVVHKVRLDGDLAVGDRVEADVDAANRFGACQAHTATHVIHAALRELVGPSATQAGSYNKPGYLRFDFSARQGLSDELRREIEERCNEAIHDDFEVTDTQMPLEQAKALGAMAMFGEKYPPIVRMVELNGPWSRELCGGTHVPTTGRIGILNLLGEQSIGSGTRRVEALVSTDAFHQMAAERTLVNELTGILKVQPDQLTDRVSKLVADLKEADRKLAAARSKELLGRVDGLVSSMAPAGGFDLVAATVAGVDGADLRRLATEVRARIAERPAVIALIGGEATRPAIVVATTGTARSKGARAGALLRAAVAPIHGRGGGKDDMAQGAGTDLSGAEKTLRLVAAELSALH
ncbi:alanine--tRNA ligase [Acidipropionibacterium virtanenii]|uniref:Alanine--tRNA ligase n=1 Tax=Acidipropionibacterium virtanenii TaxID=2057246 RepID=A0A344UU46_9ACTN|nr:alanine--tRNA ligase [Acidipropionibacterium virtanenii]AXE38794.1 Alanine--tRNA ligase [Acidipropionibacterium virtanenii]